MGFEYDPNRNARLAKIYHNGNGLPSKEVPYSYILAPTGLKLFQELLIYKKARIDSSKAVTPVKLLQPGDYSALENYEAGDFLHAVEAYKGQGAVFARAAGTFCQVMSLTQENISDKNDTPAAPSR